MNKLYFLLSISILFGLSTKAQVWEPIGDENGISQGNAGRQTLICDHQDNLVVGYYDVSVQKGSVQKYDGTQWSYLGGNAGITTGYATYNSLCVNSLNIPIFTNQGNGLEVRKFENNNWVDLPNVTDETINFQGSAFSSDDILFVASNENSGTVKRLVNGTWEQVGTSGWVDGVPLFLDITIASNDKIYISYGYSGNIYVFENEVNATSTDEWLPVGGDPILAPASTGENYNCSIAVDENDNLFIAYSSAVNQKLSVLKYDGTEWNQLGEEGFTANRVQYNSIAIGDNNIVYVAGSNWEDTDFLRNYVMAYDEDNNSWYQAGTGWASLGEAKYNSLTTDSQGNLYLSFTDSDVNKLCVRKLNLNIAAPESVEISTEGGVDPVIDIDNGSLQLIATVLPDAASQEVNWSIETGETFATISESGLLTAIASNTVVTVKASCADNASITEQISVTITNQDSDVDAEELIITTEYDVYPDINEIGGQLQLISTTYPLEADQYNTWTIEEGANIVSIDENGLVTSLSEGYATIRSSHIDGEFYDEIRVYVWEDGCTQGDTTPLLGSGMNIMKGVSRGADDFIVAEETNFALNVIRLGIITTADAELAYFDLNFFKDDDGQPGEEIITISNLIPVHQNFGYDCGVGNYQYSVELYLEEPLVFSQGTYWINPEGVSTDSQAPIYWETTVYGTIGDDYHQDSNEGHNWIPVAGGGFDGVFDLMGNCTQMPIVINVANNEDAEVVVYETLQLEATVYAEGISDDVVWTVESGSEFASVDNNGLVTGLDAGNAVIRASSIDDENIFDEIEIEVLHPSACYEEVLSPGAIENAYLIGGEYRLAIDINVDQNHTFEILSVSPTMGGFGTEFSFVFYKDVEGVPGDGIMASSQGVIVHDEYAGAEFNLIFHKYIIELIDPVTLMPGNYWMEMLTNAPAWEATTTGVIGIPCAFASNDTGGEWTISSGGYELVYNLDGICELWDQTNEVDLSQEMDIEVFPNPANQIMSVRLKSWDGEQVKLMIYDSFGHLVIEKSFANEIDLNVVDLPKGVYILKLNAKNQNEVRKIIID